MTDLEDDGVRNTGVIIYCVVGRFYGPNGTQLSVSCWLGRGRCWGPKHGG